MSEITCCSNCGEYYENTIDGLEDHYYGDNPFAKNCAEITSNKIQIQNYESSYWFEKLFKKIPKLERNASQELLDYKIHLNDKITKEVKGEVEKN